MAFQRSRVRRTFAIAALVAVSAAAISVSGCASVNPFKRSAQSGTASGGSDTAIGVNAYLWRASLATLSFLPLTSADPYGGVIITDWYANPEKKDERLKATVYILDTRLRADGVSAAVFRETLTNGVWTPAAVNPETNVALENAILSKARQLRLSGIE